MQKGAPLWSVPIVRVRLNVSQVDASLVVLHHILKPGELDDLTRLLLQLCTYRIDVFPLSSGRSGSVSGQVSQQSVQGPLSEMLNSV